MLNLRNLSMLLTPIYDHVDDLVFRSKILTKIIKCVGSVNHTV